MPVLALALGACAAGPDARAPHEIECLRETGTRIEVPEGKCADAPGTVITREAIDTSGAQTVGEALR